MIRVLTVILITLVVIGCSALHSSAGSKKIWPDQLIPEYSTDLYRQTPYEVYSTGGTNVCFNVRVKLPLGKVVKKLAFHYPNYFSTSTVVTLYRTIFGDSMEPLAAAYSANTGSGGRLVAEDDTINYAKIKKGYGYWVKACSENSNGRIRGITITYK